MINLPAAFTERMKQMLGREYDAFIASYDKERSQGLRVNGLKTDPAEFAKTAPFSLNPVAWAAEGFAYGAEDRPGRHPYHDAGVYYIQEPSAMIAASLLNPQPGEMILDLCAAPGGKSTQAAARLSGEGLLVSNEIHPARAKILSQNIERMGIRNAVVTNEDSGRLTKYFPAFFDGIIVDAPCSGEGMFRRDDDMVKDWTSRGPEYYSPIQRRILEQAVAMLKPGGMLLYSTCTFSRLEDEDNVNFLLESHPEMELVPFNLASVPGSADGIGLNGCMRLFPHRMKGEGHFLALLRKKSEGSKKIPTPVGHPAKPGERHPNRAESRKIQGKKSSASEDTGLRELEAFLRSCRISWEKERMFIHQEHVYYLPCGLETGLPLRFLRTGLLIGELKKGRFEPSQALAMALRIEEYPVVLNLSEEDERVARYLKGETISLLPEEGPIKGWCLVAYRGFPLGWAKGNNMTLKNKYYPGWRLQ